MLVNPRTNLFSFKFSKLFMPDEIYKKYYDYLNRTVGNIIDSPLDYLNYSIQGFNLPGLNQDIVEQTLPLGAKNLSRSSIHPNELYSKELTITFKMFDGFINYWMMFDIFKYYYDYKTKKKYLPNQRMEIFDCDGNVVTNIDFNDMLYTSISDLNLSFSSNIPEFLSFDCSFTYNSLTVKQSFDSTY